MNEWSETKGKIGWRARLAWWLVGREARRLAIKTRQNARVSVSSSITVTVKSKGAA